MQKINVEEQMSLLIQLQSLDKKLYHLRLESRANPRLIEDLEADRKAKQSSMKAVEDKIKANQILRKQKEMDLQSKEDNIKKLNSQLYSLKSNKEYQSMQHEIEGLKADNSLLEDEILGIMDAFDSLNKELNGEKQIFAEADKSISEDKKKIEARISQIDKEIADLEAHRKELSERTDRETLSKYERILASREGVALVAAIDGSCQGCYMILPPQVINEIRMKNNIVVCENCARMLYIDDDSSA